jgi:hypothetical protein
VVPDSVTVAIRCYLRQLDQVLPGVVSGFYLVGSVALGAYRDGRSDIDFIAVLGRGLGAAELRRLRFHHLRSGLTTGARAVRHGRSLMTGTCNGSFIMEDHLPTPVTEIVPVASHVGHEFRIGRGGSEVNPVGWKVLAERGVTIRGPRPDALSIDPQPALLRSWNVANLEGYWRSWTATVMEAPPLSFRLRPRWSTAGVLGAPRLHHTIATGEVISKEAAGEYALDVFGLRWHPLVTDALAYWRQEASTLRLSPEDRRHETCDFVTEVIDSARALGSTPTT